jgi:hypothetical protein
MFSVQEAVRFEVSPASLVSTGYYRGRQYSGVGPTSWIEVVHYSAFSVYLMWSDWPLIDAGEPPGHKTTLLRLLAALDIPEPPVAEVQLAKRWRIDLATTHTVGSREPLAGIFSLLDVIRAHEVDEFQVVHGIRRGDVPTRQRASVRQGSPPADRSREMAWLQSNRSEYAGKWVALNGDRLVASSDRYDEVVHIVDETNQRGSLITYVESPNVPPFAGV